MTALRSAMAIACGLSVFVGCSSQRQASASMFVPSDAAAVVELKWQLIRKDTLLERFRTLPRSATVLSNLGVSLDNSETVAAFSGAHAPLGGAETLIVMSRDVARDFLRAAKVHKLPARSESGVMMYDDGVTGFSAVVLGTVLVVGPPESVADVVAVSQRRAASFSSRPEVIQLRSVMQSQQPVHMVLAWPGEVREASRALFGGGGALLKLGGLGDLGALVEKLGIGRGIGMGCARRTNALRCNLTGLLNDDSTASMVSGGLTLLKGLSGLVPSEARADLGNQSLSDMTVERNGATVTIGISVR